MQLKIEAASPASDSQARKAILESFDLLGLTDDPRLTAITEFASSLCEAPIALVSIVESERQWFPAKKGLEARETSRDASFCAHAMLGDAIMVVPDARRHLVVAARTGQDRAFIRR